MNTGARSEAIANESVAILLDELDDIGVAVPEIPDVTVQNIVSSADLVTPLNLNTIAIGLGLELIEYEREQSALVPESEYSYIVWEDGSEAAWFVNDSSETTLNTYGYSADRYSTATEYGKRMRDLLVFELAGLPDAEAEIVKRPSTRDGSSSITSRRLSRRSGRWLTGSENRNRFTASTRMVTVT